MICKQCKNQFIGKDKNHKYTYCSRKCHFLSQIGKPTRRFERIKRKGYWFVYLPQHPKCGKQGYYAEHRLIMERKIGRYLEKTENIHHINHDKTDNRIENLMVLTNSEHGKLHNNKADGKWSRKHDSCVTCRKTSFRHEGKGLCIKCYERKRYSRTPS